MALFVLHTVEAAGVTWKVYQGSDNYGDNGAEYFATFGKNDPGQGGTPAPGVVWYDNGVAVVPEPYPAWERNADNLALAIKNDVVAGTLPQVSWVVTNQLYSEHPDGTLHDGAYFYDQVLKALNADPDVFNSTLVIIHFRRERRPVRPRPAAGPGQRDHRRVLFGALAGSAAAASRSRVPGAAAADLAVDPGCMSGF